jgi:hypothetical protein
VGLNADAIIEQCLRISGLYVEERDELVKCYVLELARSSPHFDADNPDHVAAAEASVARAIARRAPRLKNARPRPARVNWRRGRAPRKPRDNGCMSCGSKRACRNHTITKDEAIAWMLANCQTGERSRKPGPAVGGTLAEARRAPGLWDADRPVESGAYTGDAALNPRAAEAAAALRNEALARGGDPLADPSGIMTSRARDWGGPGPLGIQCQQPGSGTSCFDPRTGIERRWDVVGRTFTPAELGRFMKEQCTPRCDSVPVSAGAPPDARVAVKRIAPRNLAVKKRLDCRRQAPPPLIPRTALKPLPALAPTPGAETPPKVCRPDTVIGVDGGMFGSGWWRVIRDGQRLLVPNPELCGGPIPRF